MLQVSSSRTAPRIGWQRAALLLVLMLVAGLPGRVLAAPFSLAPLDARVQAGQAIVFVGAGFSHAERVASWATGPDGGVVGGEYATAASDGALRIAFFVPRNALGGRWAFTAYGETSQQPVVTTFEVLGHASDPAQPQAAVQPPVGPPGTTFAFAAAGYDDNEKVSYWITAPDGTIAAAYPSGDTANDDGRVDLSWTAPAAAPPGLWVMTIQGLKSNLARAVRFEVR